MSWDPSQYQRFEKERQEPFQDLLQLIQPKHSMTVLDLGCGDGKLTSILHHAMHAHRTLGIDRSTAMILEAKKIESPSIAFHEDDVETFQPTTRYDLVFSNACLQWLPNHAELLERLKGFLTAKGQVAIQMPSNFDFATHQIARDLAAEAPFVSFTAKSRLPAVLPIEQYATLLYTLGFERQHARLQIYSHLLPSTASLIEWVKGSLLTHYRGLLTQSLYERFLSEYHSRILHHFGNHSPYFMPFKRILLWAQL